MKTDETIACGTSESLSNWLHSAEVFKREVRYGQQTGNFHLTTAAGFRLACTGNNPSEIERYLLNEMGIREEVTSKEGHIRIIFRNHHSFATVMNALRGSFNVVAAMNHEGLMGIEILSPSSKSHSAFLI